MKKALSLILALVLCLSLCACDGGEKDTTPPVTTGPASIVPNTKPTTEPTTEPTEPVIKLNLGETASTDIAEFTLLNSTFTYYASALSTNYVAPVDNDQTYAAGIGHCLVSVTFTIKNKDRGGSISFAGGAGKWKPNWTVSYEGTDYPVKGFRHSSSGGNSWIDLAYSAILSADGQKTVKKHGTSNYLLSAGETVTLRTIGVIDVDPQNLTDGFDFTIGVINSKGEYEYFTYTIPAR